MYTTLNMLKQVEACKPGFGRMLAFFGLGANVKEQKIPLHVVSLVGQLDDAGWAMSNGLVIDPQEFDALRRRHLVPLFMYKMYKGYIQSSSSRQKMEKKPLVHGYFKRALELRTYEQVDAFLQETRFLSFENSLFKDVLRNDAWNDPLEFLKMCKDQMSYKLSTSDDWYYEGELARSYIPHMYLAIAGLPTDTPFIPLGKTAISKKKSPAPRGRAAVRRRDEEDEDREDDEDQDWQETSIAPATQEISSDTTAVLEAVSAGTAIKPKAAPIKIPDTIHIFKEYMPKRNNAENFARILSTTPFDFMRTMTYRMPKAVKVKPETNGTMTVTVGDTESMLRIVRSLNSASATFEGDIPNDENMDEDDS